MELCPQDNKKPTKQNLAIVAIVANKVTCAGTVASLCHKTCSLCFPTSARLLPLYINNNKNNNKKKKKKNKFYILHFFNPEN